MCSFVEVKGTSKMEPELLIIPSEEEGEATRKKAVPLRAGDGLGAVADALSSSSLGPDSCVRLLWPRHRCPLLSDDIVLVDTPGMLLYIFPKPIPEQGSWFMEYTHYDEHGTVTMGRYQDPRPKMGHLISIFQPDGTSSFSSFCCPKLFWGKHMASFPSQLIPLASEMKMHASIHKKQYNTTAI